MSFKRILNAILEVIISGCVGAGLSLLIIYLIYGGL